MKKTINIELAGHEAVFILDETAYNLVEDYLARARANLNKNPDRGEVVQDLEQAIGDKLKAVGENPLTVTSVKKVLEEIGPVRLDSPNTRELPSGKVVRQKRRLYRIKEGQQIAGVCQGIAIYSSVDRSWVEFIFMILAVITGGFFLLVYFGLMFFLPILETKAEYFELQKGWN